MPSHAKVGNLSVVVFGCTLTAARARFLLTIGTREEPVWTIWGGIHAQRSEKHLSNSIQAHVIVASVVAPCTLKYLVHAVMLTCLPMRGHGFGNHSSTVGLHLRTRAPISETVARQFSVALPAFAAVHRSLRPALTCTQGVWNDVEGLNWPLLRAWKQSWIRAGFAASIGFATSSSTCKHFVEQGVLTHCEVHAGGRLVCNGCHDVSMRAHDPALAATRTLRPPWQYISQPIQHTLCLLYAQESGSSLLASVDFDEIVPPVPTVVAQLIDHAFRTPDAIGFLIPGTGRIGEENCNSSERSSRGGGKPVVLPERTSEVSVHHAYGEGWQHALDWRRLEKALPRAPFCLIRRGPWHRKCFSPIMTSLDWNDTQSDARVVWEDVRQAVVHRCNGTW